MSLGRLGLGRAGGGVGGDGGRPGLRPPPPGRGGTTGVVGRPPPPGRGVVGAVGRPPPPLGAVAKPPPGRARPGPSAWATWVGLPRTATSPKMGLSTMTRRPAPVTGLARPAIVVKGLGLGLGRRIPPVTPHGARRNPDVGLVAGTAPPGATEGATATTGAAMAGATTAGGAGCWGGCCWGGGPGLVH